MKHKKRDGIALAEVKMNAGNAGGRIGGTILRYLMAAAGTYGAVFSLIGSLSMNLRSEAVLLMIFGMTSVFFLILLKRKYLWFTTSAAFLLLSLFLLREWQYLKNGLWCLENAYINNYNDYTGQRILRYIIELEPERSLTVLFVPIVYFAALVFVMAVIGMAGKSTLLLVTLPFVLVGLTVGKIPEALPFLSYLISLLFVFGMERVPEARKKSRSGISAGAGGILAAAALLLMLLFHLLIPEERYPAKAILDKKLGFLSAVENFNSEKAMQWLENSPLSGITDRLDRLGLFDLFGTSTVGDGGLGGGKLGRVDEVVFDHQTALKVQMPVSEIGFYMRGYVGVHYKGDRWEGLTAQEERLLLEFEADQKSLKDGIPLEIKNQNALFYRQMEQNEALREIPLERYTRRYSTLVNYFARQSGRVINVSANPYYYYVPYNVDYDSMSGLDGTVLYGKPDNKKQKDYGFHFYSAENNLFPGGIMFYPSMFEGTGNADWNAYMEAEEKYADLVEQIYLEVPDGLGEVRKIADELNEQVEMEGEHTSSYYEMADEEDWPVLTDVLNFSKIDRQVSLVVEYLSENMRYTLSPGRLPDGKDFVSYFLTESKQGYCSYYASAGIILLRMMGLPARYAEGYLVSGDDIAHASVLGRQSITEYGASGNGKMSETIKLEISVPDSNAHAWAEIYLRGFGWIPIEMTSGFYEVLTGGIPEQATENESESTSETTEAESEETTQKETVQETSEELTQPSSAENTGESDTGGPVGGETAQSADAFQLPVWAVRMLAALAAVSGVILCLLLTAVFVQKRLLSLYEQEKRDAAVLALYRRCLRLFRLTVTLPEQEEDTPEYAAELDGLLRAAIPPAAEADTVKLMNIAVKARYSGHEISEEEREWVLNYYQCLKKAFYQTASGGKRFFAKYFLLMNEKT